MKRLTKQYIAGFFDGEGCISMGRCRKSIFPMVHIVNTNREILNQIQKQYGGDIFPILHRRANWKKSWSWRLQWSAAVKFLDDILPWLVIKERQAVTVIAWHEARPNKGEKWDKEALDLFVERMKWLNKKGPNESSEDPILAIVREAETGQVEFKLQ